MGEAEASIATQIEAIITGAGGWCGATLAHIRRTIMGTDAAIAEDIKWRKPSKPEGVATWVCGGNVCMADVLKNAVRLTFPRGARVDDPAGLFNARLSGGTVRAIDFFEDAEIDDEELERLVRRAIHVNRSE